jgi:hypothetical protein
VEFFRVKMSYFLPFNYLPDIKGRDNQLQVECEKVVGEMLNGELIVPDSEFFDSKVRSAKGRF